MKLLLKSIRIIDPNSPFNGKIKDIYIENGIIKNISENIPSDPDTTILDRLNQHVSIGWFDFKANFCDPGFEDKEDIESGSEAALYGGFTNVGLLPNTQPHISKKSQVNYINNKSANLIIKLHPYGTLSEEMKGKDLSELYDMTCAGALAFTDDKRYVQDSGLLQRALQYSNTFNSLIITFPDDPFLSAGGLMNEGELNYSLGLKPISRLAEEIGLKKHLSIASYNNCRIHISGVSTKESIQLIRKAKSEGVKVTCDVAIANLYFDENELVSFDSNYKVFPPLRTKNDIEEIERGLKDGTIDVICSDHTPIDIEGKKCEFDYAKPGIASIQTTFSMLNEKLTSSFLLEEIILLITHNPRKVLNLPFNKIDIGQNADLTIFDPAFVWNYNLNNNKSKSINNPLIGRNIMGLALAVVNKSSFKILS